MHLVLKSQSCLSRYCSSLSSVPENVLSPVSTYTLATRFVWYQHFPQCVPWCFILSRWKQFVCYGHSHHYLREARNSGQNPPFSHLLGELSCMSKLLKRGNDFVGNRWQRSGFPSTEGNVFQKLWYFLHFDGSEAKVKKKIKKIKSTGNWDTAKQRIENQKNLPKARYLFASLLLEVETWWLMLQRVNMQSLVNSE